MLLFVKDIARYRNSIGTLCDATIKTTVAPTRLGWLWWFMDPLLMMLIYYFVIGIVFQRGSHNYHLFALCGIVTWHYFARAVNSATTALSQNHSVIKQIGVPMAVLVVIPIIVQLFFALLGVGMIMLWSYSAVSLYSLAILPLLLLVAVFAYGAGLFLSILHVRYRDTGKVLSYALRAGFFLSPVLYDVSRVTASESISPYAKELFTMNPMAWIIPAVRNVLLYGEGYDWHDFMIFLLAAVTITQAGLIAMRAQSQKIAKMI